MLTLFSCPWSPEPCPPTNVSSQLLCSGGTAHIHWATSANAVSYSLTAVGTGQNLTCTSTTPNCTLSSLVCGEPHDILVTATDGTCVSNPSDPFRQKEGTAPNTPPYQFKETNQNACLEEVK